MEEEKIIEEMVVEDLQDNFNKEDMEQLTQEVEVENEDKN